VLAGGEWAPPVSLWRREQIWVDGKFRWGDVDPSLYAELDPLRGANLLVSNNHGKSWEVRGRQRSVDPCFDENIVFERTDGSLVMYARDQHGIVRTESSDRGRNWLPFRREWYTASARFFATKPVSGKWLMVRHDTATGGRPLAPDRVSLFRRGEELARAAAARRTRRRLLPGRLCTSGRADFRAVRHSPRPRRNPSSRLHRGRH